MRDELEEGVLQSLFFHEDDVDDDASSDDSWSVDGVSERPERPVSLRRAVRALQRLPPRLHVPPPIAPVDHLALLEEDFRSADMRQAVDPDVRELIVAAAGLPKAAAFEVIVGAWSSLAHLGDSLSDCLRACGWSPERANEMRDVIAKHCRHARDGDLGGFCARRGSRGRKSHASPSVQTPAPLEARGNPTYEIRGWERAPPAVRPTVATLSPRSFRAWVLSEARALMASSTRRGVYPGIPYASALLLLRRPAGTDAAVREMLDRACVTLHDPRATASVRSNADPIRLCGVECHSLEEAHLHDACMRKDRVFRTRVHESFAIRLSSFERYELLADLASRKLDLYDARRSRCSPSEGSCSEVFAVSDDFVNPLAPEPTEREEAWWAVSHYVTPSESFDDVEEDVTASCPGLLDGTLVRQGQSHSGATCVQESSEEGSEDLSLSFWVGSLHRVVFLTQQITERREELSRLCLAAGERRNGSLFLEARAAAFQSRVLGATPHHHPVFYAALREEAYWLENASSARAFPSSRALVFNVPLHVVNLLFVDLFRVWAGGAPGAGQAMELRLRRCYAVHEESVRAGYGGDDPHRLAAMVTWRTLPAVAVLLLLTARLEDFQLGMPNGFTYGGLLERLAPFCGNFSEAHEMVDRWGPEFLYPLIGVVVGARVLAEQQAAAQVAAPALANLPLPGAERGDQQSTASSRRRGRRSCNSVRYQGLLDGTFVHNVNVEGLDGLVAALESVSSTLPVAASRGVVALSVLVAQLHRATSFWDCFLAIVACVSGVEWLWAAVSRRVFALRDAIPHALLHATLQSFSLQGEGAVSSSADMRNVWERIWDLFTEMLCGPFLFAAFSGSWGVISLALPELAGALKREALRAGAKSVVERLVAVLGDVKSRISAAVAQRSFGPLFGEHWDPGAWTSDVAGLLMYFPQITARQGAVGYETDEIAKLARAGRIPRGIRTRLTLAQYRTWLEHYVESGERMVAAGLPPGVDRDVSLGLRSLRTQIETVATSEFGSAARAVPCVVFLFGLPGVGKSYISEMIHKSVGNLRGYDVSPTSKYLWRAGVNFQDSFDHTQWAVFVDDIDQGTAKDVATQQNHFQLMIDLANSTPLSVEKADVALKGRIFASPSLVLWCTNFRDGNLRTHTLQPEAFWRRVSICAEVTVDPAFCLPGSTQLDRDKASRAGTSDVYLIRIFERKKEVADWFEFPYVEKEVLRLHEFLILCARVHLDQLVQQQSALSVDAGSDISCGECGQSLARNCPCPRRAPSSAESPLVMGEDAVRREDGSAYGLYRTEVVDDAFIRRAAASGEWQRRDASGAVYYFGPRRWGTDHMRVPDFSPHSASLSGHCVVIAPHAFDAVRSLARWLRRVRRRAVARYRLSAPVECLEEASVVLRDSCVLPGPVVVGAIGLAVIALTVFLKSRRDEQGRIRNEATGQIEGGWERVKNEFPIGMDVPVGVSYTRDQLLLAVSRSVVKFKGPRFTAWGVMLVPGTLLLPTHLLDEGESACVVLGGRDVPFTRTRLNARVLPSNDELCVIRAPQLLCAANLLPYIPKVRDTQIQTCDEVEIWSAEGLVIGVKGGAFRRVGPKPVLAVPATTLDGTCGAVYVCRVGSAWRVMAVHYALNSSVMEGDHALGVPLARVELDAVLESMAVVLQGVYTPPNHFTEGADDFAVVPFRQLPAKSEVLTAMTFGSSCVPLGELEQRPKGMTPRSSVRRTPHASLFEDLEERECGRVGYWGQPIMKGFMHDGQWRSPYQDALLAHQPRDVPQKLLWIAFMDYLQGVEDLDREGFAQLSEQEAIAGVDGTWVNRINHKTSVGPPLVGKKHTYYAVEEDGEAYMHGRVRALHASIQEAVVRGDAVAPVAVCVLKDEGTKPNKFARVFSVLPAAFNIELKRAVRPVLDFMRANCDFFEGYVGVDMTSADSARVVAHLSRVDPSLESISDDDTYKMDKTQIAQVVDLWVLFVVALSTLLGLDSRWACSLVRGASLARLSIKGDVFLAWWNISGQDDTVQVNGFETSITTRMEYYRDRVDEFSDEFVDAYVRRALSDPRVPSHPSFDFRKRVALVTYGDDKLVCARKGTYTIDDAWVFRVLGKRVTDGTKDAPRSWKPLSDVQFLKRSFVWDSEMGRYLMVLSRKSIVKTCVVRLPTELSDVDHGAQTLSGVLRECVGHGRDFYDEVRERILRAAEIHGLDRSSLFAAPTFSAMRDLLRDPNFSAAPGARPVGRALDAALGVDLWDCNIGGL